jgi:hypothetical protein
MDEGLEVVSHHNQYTCGTCGSHDLLATPIVVQDTREDPPVKVTGDWVLTCGNGHRFVATAGTVVHITGESR